MSSNDSIIETIQGNIGIIKYNRPAKKNAIDLDMYMRMPKILEAIAADDSVTVCVFTGAGDYFSSGNDLISALERQTSNPEHIDVKAVLRTFVEAFINFPKTLIAIVNGPAIGIAATTLALFDLVFAVDDAFFYTPFTKLGLIAEGCSSYTFPRMLGDRKAIEMLLFNHKMSAQEAFECGFVNYLYKPEELQTKVWDKIVEVSKLPKNSLTSGKILVRSHIREDLLRVNSKEIDELEKIWTSEEYLSIIMEFIETSKNKKKDKKSKL